jgi:mRNA interferase MazF
VTNGSLLQGDIYWVDFDESDDAVGTDRSEQNNARPAVVVQNNARNRSSIDTVIVCTLTRNLNRDTDPGNVLLEADEAGLEQPCVVNVSQVFTVRKQDLRERIGTLDFIRVWEIYEGLRLLLGPRDD